MGMMFGMKRLSRLFGRRPSECHELRALASSYLEEDLPADLRERLRLHLEWCENCGAFLATFRETIEMLQSLPRQKMPQELKRALLKDDQEGGQTSGKA